MIFHKNEDKWTYYIGTFLDDMRHGQGILYFEEYCRPEMLEGEWEVDELQTFEEYDSEEEERVDLALQKKEQKVLEPMTQIEIEVLVKGKLDEAVQQQFVWKKMKWQRMDP